MMKYLVRERKEHMLFDRFSDFEKRTIFLLVKQPQGFGNLQEKSSQVLIERRDTWTTSKFPAALFNLAPICRAFLRSMRSLLYALNDFIPSVTFTKLTAGCSLVIGRYGPWTWMAVASFSALESSAITFLARLGKITSLAL